MSVFKVTVTARNPKHEELATPFVEALVDTAERHGFALLQPIRWRPSDSPIRWAGKRYTFIDLALLRRPPPDAAEVASTPG